MSIGMLLNVAGTASVSISFGTIIDFFYKISMIIIAVVNIYLVIYYHSKGDKKQERIKENDRKVMMLKTLILDHNLDKFYNSYDEIEGHLKELKDRNCDKKELEKELQESFHRLFDNFINFLSAIDDNLYIALKDSCDKCRDTLLTNIADEGVNLNVDSKYRELIQVVIDENKREMLATLFKYKGI